MDFSIGSLALVATALVVHYLICESLDRDRIKQHVTELGGTLESASRCWFGPGWFGDRSDRIYKIRYFKSGDEYEAHCKTSMWSGVYLREERVVRRAQRTSSFSLVAETALELENRRLREEVAQLQRQQDLP